MMTRAYQEIYLNRVQSMLGDAFDYAVNTCGVPGDDFVKLFSVSSISKRMENGEPSVLLGKSGIETAIDVLTETTGRTPEAKPQDRFERSAEYWIGWAIAYYQWYSSRKYSEIFKALSFDDLQKMYITLHEADITKFADIADRKIIFPYPINFSLIIREKLREEKELCKKPPELSDIDVRKS